MLIIAKNKEANRIGGEGVISDTHKFNYADCIRQWRAHRKLGVRCSCFSLLSQAPRPVLSEGDQVRDITFCVNMILDQFNIVLFHRSAESQSRWGGCESDERRTQQPISVLRQV